MTSPRVLLISNPNSRSGSDALSAGVARLREAGMDVQERRSESARHLRELIAEYHERVDIVVLGGGDGTVHGALPALAEHDLILGLIPLGTANDLARNLEIPLDPEQAFEVIVHGEPVAIDLASANGVLFSNAAHMGLGVRVTEEVDADSKSRFGVLSYLRGLKLALPKSPIFDALIETDEGTRRTRTMQITVGNGRFYGGGNVVDEAADITNRRLHLYSLEPQGFWRLLLRVPLLRFGKQRHSNRILRLDAPSIRITTRAQIEIHSDGEPTTATPVTFRVHPGSLKIMAPARPA